MPSIRRAGSHLVTRASSSTLATSYGPPDEQREHVLVVLEAEDGSTGWGEASPLPFFTGETPSSIRHQLDTAFLPALAGIDAHALGWAHDLLDDVLPANSSAKAAVDMALYDLSARLLGIPVAQLLGGARRAEVPVSRPIGITSLEDAVEQATRYVAAGFGTLKLKVGVEARRDVERVRAVRESVGPDVRIRIDANQGYDLATATRVLRALEDVELEYVEQPLPAWDVDGLARLRERAGVRIAVDESLHDVRDALALIRARAADVFVIKLIKTGGLRNAKRITDLGEAMGIASTVVSPFDTQVGAAHGLELARTLPAGGPACELTVFSTQAEMATCDHRVEAGRLLAAGGAGCGVERLVELERAV